MVANTWPIRWPVTVLRNHVKDREFIVYSEQTMVSEPKPRFVSPGPSNKILLGFRPPIPDDAGETAAPSWRSIVDDVGDDLRGFSAGLGRIAYEIVDGRQRRTLRL